MVAKKKKAAKKGGKKGGGGAKKQSGKMKLKGKRRLLGSVTGDVP
jgi:hypothetical protein